MSDASTSNAEQAAFWEARTPSWLASEAFTRRSTTPFGMAAMDRLELAPGMTVLDVGCGAGPTTLVLADRVGPEGHVRGVDIAPAMIAEATARARASGVDNVGFAVADAQVDDLGAESVDRVFSQFGVMFFADPTAAFANLRRAVRTGGRLAFACWQDVQRNEWMIIPATAAAGVIDSEPPAPPIGVPGPFSMAEPEVIHRILDGAGFTSIEVTPVEQEITFDGDLDSTTEATTKLGLTSVIVAGLPDDATRARALAAIRSALEARTTDGVLRLGAAAFAVSAVARR